MHVGEALGPYRLLSELGSGGMGSVFLASVEGHVPGVRVGDRVAVKTIHPHLVTDFEMFARFVQEAELGKQIRHENVVRTIDAGMDVGDRGETVYLVMDYVDGRTLGSIRKESGPLADGLCRRVARAVARALQGIHDHGVVHADLKPENLLITRDEVVKVMDLGLAHLRGHALRHSDSRKFEGTLLYAAPEQLGDDPVDGRADLYALGIALYELIAGAHPFESDDYRVILQQQLHVTPPPLTEVVEGVTPFLSAVVEELMRKDPAERIRSAAELFQILSRSEQSRWWRRRTSVSHERSAAALARMGVRRETQMHGRDAELVTLRAAFAKARSGNGRAVLVSGERGSGKSRLVDALVRLLELDSAECDFLYGRHQPGADPAEALTDALREHVGEAAADLDAVAPPGGDRAAVILIDDLQVGGEGAIQAFLDLARQVAGRPLLVVGAADDTTPPMLAAEVDALAHGQILVLGPLDREALEELTEEALDHSPPAAELVTALAVESAGHPAVALALIGELRTRDGLRRLPDGSRAAAIPLSTLDLPESVRAVHAGRLAALTDDERDLLDLAACCAGPIEPAAVAEILGLSEGAAMRGLLRLERDRGLLRRESDAFVFTAPTIRRLVVGELPEALAEELHRMLADVLESRGAAAPIVVQHRLLAGDPAENLDEALAELGAAGRHADALDLADRALAAATLDETMRARTELRRARSLAELGRVDDVTLALRRLLGEEPDDVNETDADGLR